MNYDVSIGNFFEIVQFLFMYSVVTAIIYSYLVVRHYLDNKDILFYEEYKGICGYCFPCFYFFSRFNQPLKWHYAFTNMFFVIVGILVCVYLWVKFDKKSKFQSIVQSDGKIFS